MHIKEINTLSMMQLGLEIERSLVNFAKNDSKASLMLTGGSSARIFYEKYLRAVFERIDLTKIDIFMTDERCVSKDDENSNYKLITDSLFLEGDCQTINLHGFGVDETMPSSAVEEYSNLLPDALDILLLSMGEDGHFASIFPGSDSVFENEKKVIYTRGPKFPEDRITITPKIVRRAKKVYVMALGNKKYLKIKDIFLDPADIKSFPARLLLGSTWVTTCN